MKKIFKTVFLFLIVISAKAQQMQLNSQYMFNDFIINPSVAGTKDASNISMSFRRQWAGMNDGPISQSLSGHTYLGKGVGIGGMFYNDSYGPSRITGLGVAISYMFSTSEKTKLSFGINPNFSQFIINRNRLITEISGDNTIANATNSGLIPDVNFGALWFSDKFNFGVTGLNLLETNKDLFNVGNPVTSKINRAVYVNGGYKIAVGEKFAIKPSVLVKYMMNAPWQLDGNLQFIYNDSYWLGVSYRTNDAIVAMFGIKFNRISVGYSYDYTLSGLSKYNSGSHELFLSLKLYDNKNKSPWQKRNRIYSSQIEN
ncbi:MAG: type IX secretion system membrane protein PorP/SprF [Bacteroidota bacterium]|nr:type IX secretion system membrane protein PorP/SprF [Bacteroidota bacterium]